MNPEHSATPAAPYLVIGLGGAGAAALSHLATAGLPATACLALDTDSASLAAGAPGLERWLVGATVSRGWGCGGDPDHGAAAIQGDLEGLRARMASRRMVVILAGLAGGTGGGGARSLAHVARQAGAFVLIVGLLPANLEGDRRLHQAKTALQSLRADAHLVITAPLEGLIRRLAADALVTEVRKQAEAELAQAASGLLRALHSTALFPLGLADLERALGSCGGPAVMASAKAAGAARVEECVAALAAHPFLQPGVAPADPGVILLNVLGGESLRQTEVAAAAAAIQTRFPAGEVMVGAAVDPALGECLQLNLVLAPRRTGATDPAAQGDPSAGAATGEPEIKFEEIVPEGKLPTATASGFVAETPEITMEQKRYLAQTQIKNAGQRKKAVQQLLSFDVVATNRFAHTDANIRRQQNLDEPTWARRGMRMN